MIVDLKQGDIKVIMVKDLSRLGRDYIGVGDYIEQIFPLMGVRFIAVNNSFDSMKLNNGTPGIEVAVSNLVNNMYSRDIAKKIRAALETNWKNGKATCTNVPFGYVWNKKGGQRWEIDPEAAACVKKVFELALSGRNTTQIAYGMNELNLPTPGLYAKRKNLLMGSNPIIAPDSEMLWNAAIVWRILRRYEYTGALVMGRRKKIDVNTTSVRTLPEDKWIIAENAHAAIVTKDEYYQAQKAIRNVTPIQYKVGDDFALKGKICCGNCNRQLRHERQYGEMVFYCGYKRSAGKFSKCYGGYYREYSVNAKVARAIKTVFYALDVVNQGMQKKQSITVRCMDIEDLEKQAEAIRVEQIKLYESYADGVLLRDAYIEKKKALSEKLAALQDSIRTEKEEQECADELDEEIRALTKQASEKTYIGGLTKECVDAFVSMVYLYDDQTMKIEFNCEDVIRRALEKYGVYQTLGFVLSNYFKETTRALRCLNRAYQISGNFIILETLALTYYQHSIRDAFIEEGSDKIDPARIHTDAIEKARDALLRVFSAADEMWLKGTFGRAGLQIFKCFYFMHDNFRIYKHYHDVMKYFDFPDGETKRDIQLCYLDVAIRKEPVNIDDYDALTDHDKKFYELAILLEAPMRLFNVGLDIQAPISEKELLNVLTDGEKRLQELIETQTDDRLGFDGVHTSFANLYGNGIMRFQWHAISEVKRHCESIKNPTGIESFQIYIDELETYDFKAIENRYKAFFEKYDDIISFEEWCHFYIRHGEYLKTKELYDSVFDERKYLIEDQPEYFYRSYIDFTLAHQFDLTPALRCFVEHSDEFKDIFIYMSFEMDLKFATCTFNDPDQMLDDVKILLDEGLYTEADYNEKCLIINMLNCRPVQAEQYAGWAHGMHPLLSSKYERMLLVWKGAQVMPNTHWNSMQQWIASQMFDVYKKEKWLRNPKDILFESCTSENKAIVVDLWTLYFFVKVQAQEVMSHFKTIYITYDTVSMALQEINQVNDDDIRRVLIHLQREGNVKLLSPTLEQQLTVRNPSYNFMEVHSACLLAQELNCPAFVGEFRFEIPEQLRSKVIRPDNLKEVMDCVMDKKLLEAE